MVDSFFRGQQRNSDTQLDEIIPESLYLSDVWKAESLKHLQANKITHIVTVSQGIKPKYPSEFKYMVIPVDDVAEESIKKYFKSAIDFID